MSFPITNVIPSAVTVSKADVGVPVELVDVELIVEVETGEELPALVRVNKTAPELLIELATTEGTELASVVILVDVPEIKDA